MQDTTTNTKPIMNKLARLAVVAAAGAALLQQAAQGQSAPSGDLILGFTSATASKDYVVDLGTLSTFSSSSITHLGSAVDLSTLNATITSGLNIGASYGLAGGIPGDSVGISLLRTGNNIIGTPGTESGPVNPSGNNVSAAESSAVSILLGTPANSDQFSFTGQSDKLTAGTFGNALGASPLSPVSGSAITLDLFQSTRLANNGRFTAATPFSYIGSLQVDLAGPSAVVDYAVAGLLVLSRRHLFCRSNA
jgi:hypothetical protein